jgi:hypothetical protein
MGLECHSTSHIHRLAPSSVGNALAKASRDLRVDRADRVGLRVHTDRFRSNRVETIGRLK